jgi:actin-like ATPase involved in cell morphogenesis
VPYHLGVDLGTTYCAAAVLRDGQAAPEVVTLGASNPVMPSVVLLRADGTVLHGEAAERRAVDEPTRVGREFKRRLGDATPLVLGGTPYGAEALMARLLRAIVALVTDREGAPPATVTLTHPANYGPYKLEQMRHVATGAGLDPGITRLLAEPEAAALSYAARDRVLPDEVVAVYDFGGGTFDAALVRREGDGFVLIGRPDGLDRFGGIDIDAAIMAFVDDAAGGRITDLDADDPEVQVGVARLRDECRAAKEALSSDADTSIPVSLPGIQLRVRLTRPELEAMLRPRLVETIEALERTVASARLAMVDVSRILLVGGSSRIPLVSELLRERTHRPLAVDAHPKFAIAVGAALHARATAASAAVVPPPPRPVSLAGPNPPPPPPASAAPAPVPPPPVAPTMPAAVSLPGPLSVPPPVLEPFVPAPAAPAGGGRGRWIAAGVAAAVLAIVVAVLVTRGGDEGDAATTDTTTAAPLASEPGATGPVVTGPVATDAPVTESPVTEAPVSEPLVTEAPAVVVPVPAPRELAEVFDMIGYRFTVTGVAVEPPAEFDTTATVDITLRVTNVGELEPILPVIQVRIDGLDTPAFSDVVNTPPGSTVQAGVTFSMPIDQLDSLTRAQLVVGDGQVNQAVVPLGPDADTSTVARHASATTDLDLDVPFGPGQRYVDGRLHVASTSIGASATHGLPAPAGQVWLSIDYTVCVTDLDTFFTPILVLPDGTQVAPEGLNRNPGGTSPGLPLASECPQENAAVALWAVDPAVVAGQTLTVLLDDDEDDQLPGSFTFVPPVLPPPDQPPA